MNDPNTPEIIKNRWPKPGQLVIGILFITLGAIWLMAQLMGEWFISDFWPLFLVAGGLIFYAAYFLRSQKPPGYEGMLFPGTYLIILGLLFTINNFIGWRAMRYLWPTFLFAIVISLASMYKFGSKENPQQKKDLLSAIKVLSIISFVLYLIAIGGLKVWPIVLIIIGAVILFRGFVKRKRPNIFHNDINEE